MKKSLYLIIDSTSEILMVGLWDKHMLVQQKKEGQKHSENLIKTIEELLVDTEKNKKDITHIIVVTGPGSYTGTRVGVASANALSYALKVPVCGITRFEIAQIAHPSSQFFAISSYQSHVLVQDNKSQVKKMVHIDEAQKKEKIIEIIQGGHPAVIPGAQSFDYIQKEKMLQWIQALKDRDFSFSNVNPVYFKNAAAKPKKHQIHG